MPITNEMVNELNDKINSINTERTMLNSALVMCNHHFNTWNEATNDLINMLSAMLQEVNKPTEAPQPTGINVSGQPCSEEEIQNMNLPEGSIKLNEEAKKAILSMFTGGNKGMNDIAEAVRKAFNQGDIAPVSPSEAVEIMDKE